MFKYKIKNDCTWIILSEKKLPFVLIGMFNF